jgi:hypothetical protein
MEDNISPSPSNTKNKNITLEDIKLFYKDRFIDFTRLPSNRYDNITSINLTDNIKYIGKIDSNDIWLETQNNIFLCGVPFSPTRSWYKIKEINEIDIFQDYFNKINKDCQNSLKFVIELDKMSFGEFLSFIYLHNFTEKHISENLKDLNRSIKNNLIIYDDQIRILNSFTKSNSNSFYIKTKYSKTIVYCEYNSSKNYVLVNVSYDELKLKNRYENLPTYCPSDIGIIFNSFNTLFLSDIFDIFEDTEKLTKLNENQIKYYIDILFKISDKNKIKKDLDKSNFCQEIKLYINDKFDLLECDILFNKIEKEGVFKAFENSFDILLQTFYEKINNDEKIQLNSLYLTEKLKNKIDEIFKSKLI